MNASQRMERWLEEQEGTDNGSNTNDVISRSGLTITINTFSYNALAVAGLVVASVVVLALILNIACRRARAMRELRLTHVSRCTAWFLIIFTVASLIASAVIMVLASRGIFDNPEWERRWIEKEGAPNWCEATNPQSLIKNPANTMSNVFFVIAGVAMIGLGIEDVRALIARGKGERPEATYDISDPSANITILRIPSLSILWGLMNIYLGLASGIYHAQLVQFWGYMDVASMYAVLSVPVLYDLLRFTPWDRSPRIGAVSVYFLEAGIITATILAIFFNKTFSENIVPFIIVGLVGADISLRLFYMFLWPRKSQYNCTGFLRGFMALGTGVATVVLRVLEQSTDCPEGVMPNSYLQVHAVFHICAAEAIFLSYLCTRTETFKLSRIKKTVISEEEINAVEVVVE